MTRHSKRYKECEKLFDKEKYYDIAEAVSILKKFSSTKFNESVEINMKLNVDVKAIGQPIRGTVVLPHGTGKKVRIIVFCKGEDIKKAQEEGADFAGEVELVDKINSGWLEFDVAISTPEMMRDVSRLGKILGPRGLMPSPKAGTVNQDVKVAVREVKSGKIEFKMDKQTNVQVAIGKISFSDEMLKDNGHSLIKAVTNAKPSTSKGQYLKSISVSTTMGPGIRIDITKFK